MRSGSRSFGHLDGVNCLEMKEQRRKFQNHRKFVEWQRLVRHVRSFWGVWLLATAAVFLWPMRLGVKVDAAMYGAAARAVLETGVWWPLSLHPDLHNPFYLQPPMGIWGMAITAFLFGPSPWSYLLFSRFCCVLTYFLLALTLLRIVRVDGDDGEKKGWEQVTFFLFLLPTWGIWLKYASDGQLDGPLGFGIAGTVACAIYALFPVANENNRNVALAGLFAFSGLAFLFKALFFVPIVLALGLWAIVFCSKKTIAAALASLGGH